MHENGILKVHYKSAISSKNKKCVKFNCKVHFKYEIARVNNILHLFALYNPFTRYMVYILLCKN